MVKGCTNEGLEAEKSVESKRLSEEKSNSGTADRRNPTASLFLISLALDE